MVRTKTSVWNAEDTPQRPQSGTNKPQNRIKKQTRLEAAPTADKSSSSWVCSTPVLGERTLPQDREQPRRPPRTKNVATRHGVKVRSLTADLSAAAS